MVGHLWALVLAGGEGSRIRHLTTDAYGRSVPKQYASLNGDASMLRKTLERAERIVPRERVMVVVARQHREFWHRELSDWPPGNVIAQPSNRGTGIGLLLGLLLAHLRDPRCGLLILPSDHHVDDEDALRRDLLRAADHALRAGGRPTLLGVTPERVDAAGLGWILTSGGTRRHVRQVAGFVEKPHPAVARRLASSGALVNSMILAAGGNALLTLFKIAVPRAVARLRRQLSANDAQGRALASLYETLPACDFSRDVLQKVATRLVVLPTRACGWTDIGTPARLSRLLGQHPEGTCVA